MKHQLRRSKFTDFSTIISYLTSILVHLHKFYDNKIKYIADVLIKTILCTSYETPNTLLHYFQIFRKKYNCHASILILLHKLILPFIAEIPSDRFSLNRDLCRRSEGESAIELQSSFENKANSARIISVARDRLVWNGIVQLDIAHAVSQQTQFNSPQHPVCSMFQAHK